MIQIFQYDLPDGRYIIKSLDTECGWINYKENFEGKIMVKNGKNFFFEDTTDSIGYYFLTPIIEPAPIVFNIEDVIKDPTDLFNALTS